MELKKTNNFDKHIPTKVYKNIANNFLLKTAPKVLFYTRDISQNQSEQLNYIHVEYLEQENRILFKFTFKDGAVKTYRIRATSLSNNDEYDMNKQHNGYMQVSIFLNRILDDYYKKSLEFKDLSR